MLLINSTSTYMYPILYQFKNFCWKLVCSCRFSVFQHIQCILYHFILNYVWVQHPFYIFILDCLLSSSNNSVMQFFHISSFFSISVIIFLLLSCKILSCLCFLVFVLKLSCSACLSTHFSFQQSSLLSGFFREEFVSLCYCSFFPLQLLLSMRLMISLVIHSFFPVLDFSFSKMSIKGTKKTNLLRVFFLAYECFQIFINSCLYLTSYVLVLQVLFIYPSFFLVSCT